ncbi:hypothetical protein H9P43_000170 [Blastocladiella emersonii ATCC 22665]|nr:hypothetical protein H9P43_000170 [Blastocladiella emersonii ATCC 22665]
MDSMDPTALADFDAPAARHDPMRESPLLAIDEDPVNANRQQLLDPATPPPPLDAADFDRRVLAERVARGWWCPFPHTPASLLEQRCKDGAEARKLLNECAPIRNLADEDGVVASLLLHDSSQHTRIASFPQANPGLPSSGSPPAASAADPATPPQYYYLATYHVLQQEPLPLDGHRRLAVPGIEFQNRIAPALDSDPRPAATYVQFRDPAAAPFFVVAVRDTPATPPHPSPHHSLPRPIPASAAAASPAASQPMPSEKWKRHRWHHYTLEFYLDADAVNRSLRAGVPGAARAVRRLLRSHPPIPPRAMLDEVASASLSPPLLSLWRPTWPPASLPRGLPRGLPGSLNNNSNDSNGMLVAWLVQLEADPYVLPVSPPSALVRQPYLRIGPDGVLFNLELGDWAEHDDVWSPPLPQQPQQPQRASSPPLPHSPVVPAAGEVISAGAIFSPLSEDLFLSIAQLARVRPGRLDSAAATATATVTVTAARPTYISSRATLLVLNAADVPEALHPPRPLCIVTIWSMKKYRATTWDQIRDADLVLVAPAVIMRPDYRDHIASLVGETEYHGPGAFRGGRDSRGGFGSGVPEDMSPQQYEFSELLAERIAALNAAGPAAYGSTRGEVIFERVWFHRVFLFNAHQRMDLVQVNAWSARLANYGALLSKRSRAGEHGPPPAVGERITALQSKVASHQVLCGFAGSFKYAVVLPPLQLQDGRDFKDWADRLPAPALRAYLQHLPLGDALPNLPHADWVGFMQRATRMTTTTATAAPAVAPAAVPAASASGTRTPARAAADASVPVAPLPAVDQYATSVVAVVPTAAELLLAHGQAPFALIPDHSPSRSASLAAPRAPGPAVGFVPFSRYRQLRGLMRGLQHHQLSSLPALAAAAPAAAAVAVPRPILAVAREALALSLCRTRTRPLTPATRAAAWLLAASAAAAAAVSSAAAACASATNPAASLRCASCSAAIDISRDGFAITPCHHVFCRACPAACFSGDSSSTGGLEASCGACRQSIDHDLVSRGRGIPARLDDFSVLPSTMMMTSSAPFASSSITPAPSDPAASSSSSEAFPTPSSSSIASSCPAPPRLPTSLSSARYGSKLAAVLEYIVEQEHLYQSEQHQHQRQKSSSQSRRAAPVPSAPPAAATDHPRRGPRTVVWTQFPGFAALLVAALAEHGGICAIDGIAAGHPAAAAATEAACRAFERLDTAAAAAASVVICLNPETYLYRCAALAVSHVVFAHPLLAKTESAAHDLEMRVLAAVMPSTVGRPERAATTGAADRRVRVARFVVSGTVEVALTERRTRSLWE